SSHPHIKQNTLDTPSTFINPFFCLKESNDRQISRIEKQMKNRYNGSGGVEVGNDTIIAGNESKREDS
ncbi:MAG: hypothetical protein ACLVJX_09925, partial [Merdibacter sp.]